MSQDMIMKPQYRFQILVLEAQVIYPLVVTFCSAFYWILQNNNICYCVLSTLVSPPLKVKNKAVRHHKGLLHLLRAIPLIYTCNGHMPHHTLRSRDTRQICIWKCTHAYDFMKWETIPTALWPLRDIVRLSWNFHQFWQHPKI